MIDMLCQNCGKNEATTHIKQIVNGEMSESHLCGDCAEHLGYNDMFSGLGFNYSGIFGGLLGDVLPSLSVGNVKRCEKCGCSFDDIVREGKVGCAECYKTFYDRLLPSIHRIHGKIQHNGKISQPPAETAPVRTAVSRIEKLRQKMNEAVSAQEFEQAAKLRDEIKALERGEENG
jgi:protein arginine kinase activator